jgi:hypothetical protein
MQLTGVAKRDFPRVTSCQISITSGARTALEDTLMWGWFQGTEVSACRIRQQRGLDQL